MKGLQISKDLTLENQHENLPDNIYKQNEVNKKEQFINALKNINNLKVIDPQQITAQRDLSGLKTVWARIWSDRGTFSPSLHRLPHGARQLPPRQPRTPPPQPQARRRAPPRGVGAVRVLLRPERVRRLQTSRSGGERWARREGSSPAAARRDG